MGRETPQIRCARLSDATILAELVNYAGEGLPLYLWEQLRDCGQTAWDVGRLRAERDEGSFSYRNATVAEYGGEAVGTLMGYEIPDRAVEIAPDMPPMFVPLQELENLALGTWYVNVLGVLPAYRNLGIGGSLLTYADETGRRLEKCGMSVIVADNNVGARRLYERFGYRHRAVRDMVKEAWHSDGSQWILLSKSF